VSRLRRYVCTGLLTPVFTIYLTAKYVVPSPMSGSVLCVMRAFACFHETIFGVSPCPVSHRNCDPRVDTARCRCRCRDWTWEDAGHPFVEASESAYHTEHAPAHWRRHDVFCGQICREYWCQEPSANVPAQPRHGTARVFRILGHVRRRTADTACPGVCIRYAFGNRAL
jgi:hypothetical protein